jgi:probable F420-dependent oxidoreductase
MSGVRFIFQYPDVHGTERDLLDCGPVAELAVAAEAAGWDGFAFTEHPAPSARWLGAGGHQTLDPFVALGHVAAVTERLRLLTNLTVVPYRNPALLAKTAATVDRLSNGRLILGAGTGYLKSEFAALGVPFEERNVRFDEALDVLPLHWSGAPFDYRGESFEARDTLALPKPTQDPIPIWIGGNSRRTLERVAARAQGWMPLTSTTDISSTTRTPHLESLEALGRAIAELRELAGDRGPSLDVLYAHDASRGGESRDLFAELTGIGVTCFLVMGPDEAAPACRAFIDDFASRCFD